MWPSSAAFRQSSCTIACRLFNSPRPAPQDWKLHWTRVFLPTSNFRRAGSVWWAFAYTLLLPRLWPARARALQSAAPRAQETHMLSWGCWLHATSIVMHLADSCYLAHHTALWTWAQRFGKTARASHLGRFSIQGTRQNNAWKGHRRNHWTG